MASRIESDVHVNGHLTSKTASLPAGTITNAMVNGSAAIAASKLKHQYSKTYSQEGDTASAADERNVHVVYGATGTVLAFEAGSVTLCTSDAAITVDLHKNGVSILTAAIVLDSGNTAYTPEAGTIDTAALTDGAVLSVVVTVAAGGGALGKGVFASLVLTEDAA